MWCLYCPADGAVNTDMQRRGVAELAYAKQLFIIHEVLWCNNYDLWRKTDSGTDLFLCNYIYIFTYIKWSYIVILHSVCLSDLQTYRQIYRMFVSGQEIMWLTRGSNKAFLWVSFGSAGTFWIMLVWFCFNPQNLLWLQKQNKMNSDENNILNIFKLYFNSEEWRHTPINKQR